MPVLSSMALRNGETYSLDAAAVLTGNPDTVLPPGVYIEVPAGKVVWYEILGACVAILAGGATIYLCIMKMKRSVAKKRAGKCLSRRPSGIPSYTTAVSETHTG
jgi:hypothetical protein